MNRENITTFEIDEVHVSEDTVSISGRNLGPSTINISDVISRIDSNGLEAGEKFKVCEIFFFRFSAPLIEPGVSGKLIMQSLTKLVDFHRGNCVFKVVPSDEVQS
jgi:hypothetical protein